NGNQLDFNDNWQDSSKATEIENSGLEPNDPRESAVLPTLPPGGYTAVVRGTGPTPTGIAIVEAFALAPL
ncbi:MAG TPA: hypothetical protein VGF73_12060, partial [Chthoniobacterales bacterium]